MTKDEIPTQDFKKIETTSGSYRIMALNIYFQFDPSKGEYNIVIHDVETKKEISNVVLHDFYVVKDHIDSILKKHGYSMTQTTQKQTSVADLMTPGHILTWLGISCIFWPWFFIHPILIGIIYHKRDTENGQSI